MNNSITSKSKSGISNNASRTGNYISNKLEQSKASTATETSLTMMRATNYLDNLKIQIKNNLSRTIRSIYYI